LPYTIGIDARKLNEAPIGSYVQSLVRGLGEIDDENSYVLFVGGGYEGEFDDLPANFTRVIERSSLYSLRERIALSWRAVRNRLDLYHATHYILPVWIPRRTVTTVHGIVDLLHPDFMPGRLARYVAPAQMRSTLSRSNRIIAESENTRQDLVDYFDVRSRKISRVYPGVDPAFSPDEEPSDKGIREAAGLEGPYIVFRGDARAHRNEERVLRAFARARRKSGEDVTMLGIGERELSDPRYEHLIEDLELTDRVVWLEDTPPSSLPALLRGARLFFYPTLYEGFPIPVVEAMACAVPVITSDNGTIREVAEGSAKLVEPSSVESLAGALAWCLADEQLSRNLAADGSKRSADFSWRRVAEQTLAVYEETLTGSGDRARLRSRQDTAP